MSTVFRVKKNGNFTVMSNNHLKDRRLSYKAKGLLSVILSLPPEWDYTVKGLSMLSSDGTSSVDTALKELEKYGYLSRRRLRDELGRMSRSEYLVYENPSENPLYCNKAYAEQTSEAQRDNSRQAPAESYRESCPESYVENYIEEAEGLVESSVENFKKSEKSDNFFENPDLENLKQEIPETENRSRATYNKLNKKKSNKNQSIHSVCDSQNELNERNFNKTSTPFYSESVREAYCELIKENIDYYCNFENDNTVDELVSIMVDVVCSSAPTIRVNGALMPTEVVRSRFLKLTAGEIEYVDYALRRRSGPIRNLRSYLITLLYNSKDTVDICYQNMIANEASFITSSRR